MNYFVYPDYTVSESILEYMSDDYLILEAESEEEALLEYLKREKQYYAPRESK